MLSGWIRGLVLLVVPMLLVNAECYATCTSDACRSAQTSSNDCHHHNSSQEGDSHCPYQHSEFISPEVGITNANVSMPVTVLPAVVVVSAEVIVEPEIFPQPETGAPPGRAASSTISVLRI